MTDDQKKYQGAAPEDEFPDEFMTEDDALQQDVAGEFIDPEDPMSEDGNWEDYAEEDFAEEPAAGAKPYNPNKKSSLLSFNNIVIAGGVIFGLGFFLMQMSKQPGGPGAPVAEVAVQRIPMTGIVNEMVGQDGRSESEPVTAADDQEAPRGFLTNPQGLEAEQEKAEQDRAAAGLNQPVVVANEPPMPSPLAPAETAPAPETPAAPEGGPLTPLPEIAAAEPAPAEAAESPRLEAAPVVSAPAPEAPAPAIETLAATGPAAEQVMPVAAPVAPETDEKLQSVMSRLDEMDRKISSLASAPAPAAAVTEDQSAEIESLRRTVEGLQAQIKQLETAQKSARTVPAARTEKPVPESEAPARVTQTRPEPAPRAAAAEQSAPSSARWELRAAAPGRAWVGKPGENEMYTISVGQSWPGMGRIQSIEMQNGQWVVEGTEGRLTQ